MNQQSKPRKKQVGDWVIFTGGPNRDATGEIIAINHPMITVRTADGRELQTTAGWLVFAKRPAKRHPAPATEAPEAPAPAVVEAIPEPVVVPTPEPVVIPQATPVAPKRRRKQTSAPAPEVAPDANVAQNPYEAMTVVQLQLLAKERGISIARTKADFVRMLKQQLPEVDVATLKGPELYAKVAEHHISRLRSKQDLVVLLSQGEAQ